MRNPKSDSMATRVLEVIQANPGANVEFIANKLNADNVAVKNTVAYHRREGRIKNLGKAARGARWYPNYQNPENKEKKSVTSRNWKQELQDTPRARDACQKCGNKPIIGRIQLIVEEKETARKYTHVTSKTVVLCANCITRVYKTAEGALLEELGE
jgi:DNA modification methylase